jgi:hypothetical protein
VWVIPRNCTAWPVFVRKTGFAVGMKMATLPQPMRSGLQAKALLGLNLVLLATVGYLAYQLRLPTEPSAQPVGTVAGSHSPPTPASSSSPATAELPQTNTFHWSQLESEDYRTYIQRLRAIGCPEQTIRDIIIADVEKLLAPQARAIVPYRPDLKYWEPEEEELWNNYDPRQWQQQQRTIEYQKRELVRELLGIDLVEERLRQQGAEDYYSRRLQFLPEAKRAQVRTLLDHYADQELAIRAKEWEEGEPLCPEDRAELRRLRQARQADLARILTPAELQQYELWLGYTACKVREALYGMDATEEEFLTIYRLRKPFDEQWNPDEVDLNDPVVRARWQQAQAELEEQIRRALGETRYALYQRGQDPDFRALNAAAARYGLSSNTVAEVYACKKLVTEARQALATNLAVSAQEREQALAEIANETERVVAEALGPRAYRYLLRRGALQWIKGNP